MQRIVKKIIHYFFQNVNIILKNFLILTSNVINVLIKLLLLPIILCVLFVRGLVYLLYLRKALYQILVLGFKSYLYYLIILSETIHK